MSKAKPTKTTARRSAVAANPTAGLPGSKPNPNAMKTEDPREPDRVPRDETKPIPQSVVMAQEGPNATVPHHGGARRPNLEIDRSNDIGAEDEDVEPVKTPRTSKVRALKTGYYDDARRRAGDVFSIDPADFSSKWMEYVSGATPSKTTGPNASIRKQHDEILGGKTRVVDPLGD